MKKLAVVALLVLVVPFVALGQTAPPKPGPEHQKLGALVGNWTSEGEFVDSPFGPSQKWSATIKSEWFPGKLAVVRHWDGKGSLRGENHGLDVIAYDQAAKTYTWYGVDSEGWTELTKSSISGDVLTSASEYREKGKTYQIRTTMKGLGSDTVTFLAEYSEDGKTWKPSFRATDTRARVASSTTTAMGTGKVLGIHHFQLKPGVDPAEFERFVAEEWTPVYGDLYPGIEIHNFKGERGSAPGSYMTVYEISSLRVRDHYFPRPGEESEATTAIDKKCGARCDEIWARFVQLVMPTGYTDYFAIVKK